MSATISKKLGQFKQWTGEKFGLSEKTTASEEFRRLDEQTEQRKAGIENLTTAVTDYAKTLDKVSSIDKKLSTVAMLSKVLLQQGQYHGTSSPFGFALTKIGEAEDRLQACQETFAENLRRGLVMETASLFASMKDYAALKKKLENRRLDYDAKQNKLSKSKKENPGLEEETKIAQQKYFETLDAVETLMSTFAEREEALHSHLLDFARAQHEYFKSGLECFTEMEKALSQGVPSTSTDAMKSINRRPSQLKTILPPSLSKDSAIEVSPAIEPQPISNLTRKQFPVNENNQHRSMESALPKSRPQIKILYSFEAENEGELSCKKGEVLKVIQEIDENWILAENQTSKQGIIPRSYSEPIMSSISSVCHCGCEAFTPHPFKSSKCTSCLHQH